MEFLNSPSIQVGIQTKYWNTEYKSIILLSTNSSIYAYSIQLCKTKVLQIVSRLALTKCPLLHGNIQRETDTEIEKGGCMIPVCNNSFNDNK